MEKQDEEIIDSQNDEEEEKDNGAADKAADDADHDADTAQYTDREKQLFARAKKAETELKALKGSQADKKTTSDGFGYDVKAYLKASGIKADEFDFVQKEMKASGMDIDELLDNEYFQSKLEKRRAVARTEEAAPKGKRSGGAATNNVDYWLSKPIEEVPVEHRRAVVNAKLARENGKSQFYNT